MDYDDNDYQGQNLHLAGEGNTKFPPVLRPYALPKFDFDESLQGHLRFDSLVETEVFLGIESNEDNQWIDAYSRGSSGIEFSSSAAESCSISRHNNVWSEATSSESVEMLLKSVGQEEFIPRQTVIEESACDELACLAKQMEPNSKPDDKNIFKGDVTNLQPPDSVHESVSELKEDVGRDQSHLRVSQVHEGELSIDGNSSNQELNDIGRNIDLPMSGESLFTDGRSNNANQREVQTVADESLDDKTLDNSSASGVQTVITVGSMQNISSTCDALHIQNEQNQVIGIGDERKGCLPTKNDKQDVESSILNEDADVDNQNLDSNAAGSDAYHPNKPLCSLFKEEALEGGSVVENLEAGVSNVEESFGLVLDGVCNLQKEERCNEDVCSRNPSGDSTSEDAILLKDTITNDHSALNTCDPPMVAIKGDTGSEGQVVEISNSSCSISPNTQQNVDTVENRTYTESGAVKEKELLNSSHLMETEILVSQSDASTFIVEDNISKIGEGNGDSKVGGSSSFSVATSSVTSCILGESTQTCVNNEVEGQGDPEKFHQDVSVNDKESTKAASDSSQMHCDVDQSHLVDNGLGSSSLSGCRLETDLKNSTVSDVMAVNDSASQVISENTSLTSSEMKDVPSPSRNETTPPAGSAPVDEREHSAAKIAEKADISTPVGSSEKETAPCPVSETEKHQSCDTSIQLLCETVNNCPQNVGTDITEKISETQGALTDKVIQECTKEIGASPLLCESISKQGDEVTVSFDKQDKEKVQENYEKLPSKISGDVLFANKGSISSAPLPDSHAGLLEAGGCPANPADSTGGPSVSVGISSQTQKDGNDVKGSDQNAPISEFINSDGTKVLSIVQDAMGNNASKDEKSLTSEVAPVVKLPKKASAESASKVVRKRQSVPATTASKVSTVVEGSPSTSGLGPTKTKISGDVSHGSPQVSDGEMARSVSKGTSERKTRRASNKTAGKESSRKGSQAKETTLARQPERGDKSSNVSLSPSPGFQLMQSNEMQQYGHIDCSSTKPFSLLNSTSSLPDLNTSASPPVLFQQPFTDLQQVQLRAQIFVYGALIQGTAPDEAYMISAFGGPDGGKSIWENAWRACMERQHGQKSHPINPETPLQPRSGPRASDFAVKQSAFQGKSATSPLGRTSSKATPSVVNPLIPLSSPLWSVPTPSCDSLQSSALARGSVMDYPQALTSLHPYQTPPLRNFIGHNASWISQAPIRGPWIASPTPAPDNSSHLSASPVSDTIKSNAVKGSSLPPSSSIKNVTPGLPAPSGCSPSIFIGTAPLLDTSNVTVSPAQHSSDPKPKKRKKVIVSQDLGQKALQLQSQLESTPAVSSHTSTLAVITTPVGNVPKTTVEKAIVPLSPADHLKNDRSVEKILSEETLAKVKEARIHAEEAAADSAAAVSHSLEIWNQLDKQKNSGLVPDIEAKLASAAVSVAAAAAVAKAAAAAANVASNAALQAKLMADEALASSGYENSFQNCGISLSEGMNNLGKATPASILKVANGTNSSSSIIVAAKEAARRRVEAASAATKRAENMDAIVKAAELAAEAVSQAGKIVTMGDPLPLSDLVEAGPEGCWKTARESSQQVGLLKDMTRGLVNVGNGGDSAQVTLNVDILSDEMGKQATASEKSPLHKMYNERSDDHRRSMDGITNSININERNLRGPRGHKVSDLVSPINVVPESETELQSSSLIVGNGSEKQAEVGIKEGSLIEVFKDGEGFKAAWFTANVLSLKDGKAYVCYTVLLADGGPLKEWVTLEGEGNKPPRIRIARPLTGLRYEGTRKRRRAAMGDYAWSVGDRVDAWIQESWWEGVVTEKNKKDETTLTVHFPASGETSVVRAWHLRPSLIWKDGKWTECSRVGANENSTHEGDTPHEKRPKLASHAVETKGKDKMSKGIDAVESVNPDELRLLDLTENEKVFNIGKSSRNENKPDTQRTARTGLQKEGSRVIFGVPKPGKKRKFMEVSKHYVADGSNKINDGNDSVKLVNFLMPQGSGSRGWKNNSKTEAKEKRVDSKPKNFKSGKPQNVLGRTIPPKNNPLSNTFSHPSDLTDRTEKIKDSASHFKNVSESENQMEIASYSASDGAGEGPILYSSLATSTDAPSSKKTSTSRASKGKLAPAGGKLGKIEEEKALNSNPVKATSEVIEPRRSNRRIQPTSRLLEGLQSSLIISKIPSVSHDKSHKNQNRNAPRGHNQG